MTASSPRQGGGMIAVDTNIVVRYLTGDHPRQSTKARTLVDGNDVFLSRTVILECEWVLRSAYRYSPREIQPRPRGRLIRPPSSSAAPRRDNPSAKCG
jgi:predicted nucleic acid-binding protein